MKKIISTIAALLLAALFAAGGSALSASAANEPGASFYADTESLTIDYGGPVTNVDVNIRFPGGASFNYHDNAGDADGILVLDFAALGWPSVLPEWAQVHPFDCHIGEPGSPGYGTVCYTLDIVQPPNVDYEIPECNEKTWKVEGDNTLEIPAVVGYQWTILYPDGSTDILPVDTGYSGPYTGPFGDYEVTGSDVLGDAVLYAETGFAAEAIDPDTIKCEEPKVAEPPVVIPPSVEPPVVDVTPTPEPEPVPPAADFILDTALQTIAEPGVVELTSNTDKITEIPKLGTDEKQQAATALAAFVFLVSGVFLTAIRRMHRG